MVQLSECLEEARTRSQKALADAEHAARKSLCPESLESRIARRIHWQHPDAGAKSPGMIVYETLVKCLDSFTSTTGAPIMRSFHQRVFHRNMIMASLPLIFGKEWETHGAAIKEQLGIKENILNQVIISTPRRYGKSFSVAMFVAACLYAIPSCNVAVFSVAQRQSDMLMGHIRGFYDSLPGARERYKTKNSELFEVYDAFGGVCQLRCLPGRSETTRGVGAGIVILEEAAFIPANLFYDVIVPLLSVGGTVLIGISTPPKDGFNYYLSLFDCNDADGNPIFKIEKVQLMCDKCKEEHKTECKHIRVPEPKWKTGKRKEIQRAIYAKNPEVFMREVLGMAITTDTYVFHAQYVDLLMNQAKAPPHQVSPLGEPSQEFIKFVFIAIDPSGGGNGSDTAFAAVTFRARDYHPVVSHWLCVAH